MKQLLLIDDDELLLRTLRARFERHGMQVTCVASAAELEQISGTMDAVVVDLKFGEVNGLQLIPNIRKRFQPQHLIVLTGYASLATSVAAIKAGATDYLAKPVSFAQLLHALEGVPQEASATIPEPSESPLTPAQLEWELIQKTLQQHDGNISATARALGMHRRTLQRKLSKWSPLKS
ncbi:response regulator transcription factor [Pseudidiomarina taiwanensis]|uniref:Two-component system response regulator n=1 Tax=Pseudidiomarina taiwanensis TaxID=337250 RepID=A0A432ZEH1_9GAMM|nr:response regulator [Pseudidiomarina taiwanensis]RUO76367.1 two-component system response regulator [Pseudidiomarina taiwanensis]